MSNSQAKSLYIGLMSGTSADGIDAALVEFEGDRCKVLATLAHPLEQDLKESINTLSQPGSSEIDAMGELDVALGQAFSAATLELLKIANVAPPRVCAIGSHGQTLRHRPYLHHPFTLQIGDANIIAELTGINTVSDFRRRDMAAGGQGAPLAPALHRALFSQPTAARCIVNIGGISNITILNPLMETTLGYDTGPGNTLLDGWIQKRLGRAFDRDGQWAATGKTHEDLLCTLLSHPFFSMPSPKSTGREDFHTGWLIEQLALHAAIKDEDIQTTLVEFTARTIALEALKHLAPIKNNLACELYICGGGAHNRCLVSAIARNIPGIPVATTESLGIHPDWVEAVLFAWLAKQTMDRKSGNLPAVTGANHAVILGAVHYASVSS
ncbi:MAG: anhydro-N-acetylmuramic acid kinase [Lentisphaeria bacterium]